jgi:hypothetical protein
VHVDGHPLALGEKVCNADRCNGDFLFHDIYFIKYSNESILNDLPSKRSEDGVHALKHFGIEMVFLADWPVKQKFSNSDRNSTRSSNRKLSSVRPVHSTAKMQPVFSFPLTLLFTVAGFLIVEHRFSLTAF